MNPDLVHELLPRPKILAVPRISLAFFAMKNGSNMVSNGLTGSKWVPIRSKLGLRVQVLVKSVRSFICAEDVPVGSAMTFNFN
jgi:hypothetical protein